MAAPTIQTSFASGEWAPKLRSRVDIQKYHAGAALLKNFFVDFAGGGASTRNGTKFIGQTGINGARLIPFQPSSNLSYVLEFGQNYIRFYSNGVQILSGASPYQILSPYAATDLFPNQLTGNPGLKFVQDVTSLIITHPAYPPQILTIISPTNWTLIPITFGPTINPPAEPTITTTSATGAGYNYAYIVTALDVNNQESGPSIPGTISNLSLVTSTAMTNKIAWPAVSGAASYNVYKASPSYSTAIPVGAPYGFIGNTTGTSFLDAEPGIASDFSQTPPIILNPFLGGSISSLNLTGNDTYTTVPLITIPAPPSGQQATGLVSLGASTFSIASGGLINVPAGQTSVGLVLQLPYGVYMVITADSGGATVREVVSVNIVNPGGISSGPVPTNPVFATGISSPGGLIAGPSFNLTWQIASLGLISGGSGYLTAPVPTFSSGAATATTTLGTLSSGNPGVPGFLQERLMLAGQTQAIQSYNLSQPGSFFNFNVSNPSEDDDAISGTIISEELNDVRSLLSAPTGMIILTGNGAWLLNGGGGISTANPITPSSQSANPQAFNGANDLRPQKIGVDIIYGTNKGSYFRDLTYNIYANIYTGADISVLSNHFFFNYNFLDIAWAEEPFKLLYVVRNDGLLLTLTFVKDQELIGWTQHDTNGQFKSVCSVIETVGGNVVDAVYVIVGRVVNSTYVEYVERFVDRYFNWGCYDAWSVDCGLQTAATVIPAGAILYSGNFTAVGNVVSLIDNSLPFTSGMVGWKVFAQDGGVYQITAFVSTLDVTATILRVPNTLNQYTSQPFSSTQWSIWEPVTSVTGLTQLAGQAVVGVADGVAIGPLTVSSGGVVDLPFSACKVTLGLLFLPQGKTLPLDLGEPTVQSKRKKVPSVSLRVADTLGLQVGTSFANAVTVKDFQLGAIPSQSNGPSKIVDLVNLSTTPAAQLIDGFQILDQLWQEPGQICFQQNLPYPATILGIMPEVEMGDTKK